MMRRVAPLALLAGTLLAPLTLSAQEATTNTRPSTVLSANPFLPLLGYFQGEFEKRVKDNLAIALGFSHIQMDGRYTNADLKARLYPQEKAPYGLGLAAGIGVGNLRDEQYVEASCAAIGCPTPGKTQVFSRTAPSFSVELHYQWLLGRKQSTAVGFGFGAKRYFIADNTNEYGSDRFQEFVPTGRITVGWAFGKR